MMLSIQGQSVTKTMKRLPDTGQESSFTNTFGEDHDYSINKPFFLQNGNGTVTDTITGLMWQKTDGGEMTVENAAIYCDTLTLGGYTDWRLPNCHELYSILNHNRVNPAMDINNFTTTTAEYWWSSQRQNNDPTKVWATNAGGGVGNHPKAETISAGGNKRFHVRAVRDVNPTSTITHFTNNGNGTVTDNLTGLMWVQAPASDTLNWENALTTAESLSFAGYDDWRLPNIKELQSINDESIANPSVSATYFSIGNNRQVWSSTTLVNQPTQAWYLQTKFGITTYSPKTSRLYVMFVRTSTPTVILPEQSIILGRPTDTSITASILFDQAVQYYLEYGTLKGTYNNTTPTYSNAGNITDEVDLKNLAPDTRYYYRMKYKAAGAADFAATPEYSFHTQRSEGATFSFTVEADEHLYDIKGVKSIYQICLNNQLKDNPDFMLSLGDIFGDDHYPYTITSAQLDQLHKDYRPILGSICHSVPFYVCLGNHEGENDYYYSLTQPNNLSIWATQWRQFYYPNPYPNRFYSGNTNYESFGIGYPENYFSWKWGDAQFIVLDVYRDQCDTSEKPVNWDWSLGLPQYTWLKNTLETSTAKYKFVFAHHIRGQGRGGVTNARLFEWGGYDGANGTNYSFPIKRPGWAKPIHQLFVDNGVNIFFQGHDHLFAHEVLDGVTYQEVPMPSDSTYQIGWLANAGAYLTDTLAGTGHIRVTVSPECVKVDYVRAALPKDTLSGLYHNGEVAFSYSIGSCINTMYRFTGNGDWDIASNWLNNTKPPVHLPAGSGIVIDPLAGGKCVLSRAQYIDAGASLRVEPGKNFEVQGNLVRQ